MIFKDAKVGDTIYVFLTGSKTVAINSTGDTLPATIVAQEAGITVLGWKKGEPTPLLTGTTYILTLEYKELGFVIISKYYDRCECAASQPCMHDCCRVR